MAVLTEGYQTVCPNILGHKQSSKAGNLLQHMLVVLFKAVAVLVRGMFA